MSFNTIRENKILAKISGFTVLILSLSPLLVTFPADRRCKYFDPILAQQYVRWRDLLKSLGNFILFVDKYVICQA